MTICIDFRSLAIRLQSSFYCVQLREFETNTTAFTDLKSCVFNANLVICDVPGDGNCLYWSILHQLKACALNVGELREMTAAYLESRIDFHSQCDSIPPCNPINADTEAPDDRDAQTSKISDPQEHSQARWFKYLESIWDGAWGDNLCIAASSNLFSVTVNV